MRRGSETPTREPWREDADGGGPLIKDALVARYSEDFATTLQTQVHQEYEQLIPEIPCITGLRAKALSTFLLGTAQELAVYEAGQEAEQRAPADSR